MGFILVKYVFRIMFKGGGCFDVWVCLGPYVQHKMADGIGSIAWNVKTSPVLVPANVTTSLWSAKWWSWIVDRVCPSRGIVRHRLVHTRKWTAWHWQQFRNRYDTIQRYLAGQASSKIIMCWLSLWLSWQVLNTELEQLQSRLPGLMCCCSNL